MLIIFLVHYTFEIIIFLLVSFFLLFSLAFCNRQYREFQEGNIIKTIYCTFYSKEQNKDKQGDDNLSGQAYVEKVSSQTKHT